jgi:hypothetical protein
MHTLAAPDDAGRIRRRLAEVTGASPRRWGRMTPHQMLCHVADSFRLALGERPAAAAGGVVHRTLLKWVALYGPLPAGPPPGGRGYPTLPELDQERGGTAPAEFEADRAECLRLLDRLVSEPARVEEQRHPLFGALRAAEWHRLYYRHTDYHLRQFGH